MTHGEEPGPETHKDSVVLTYLEGLLMHPVVAGPGATASRRSESAHSNQEQNDKVGRPFQPPNQVPTAPKAGTNGPTLGSSQHLKKARLLRSGAWNDPANQPMSSPPVELNGQGGGLQNGTLEGSPHAGESTLLASLLQSFSSRLQSVAMSQHPNKPPSECSSPSKVPTVDKESHSIYGSASSRLKGLMRKNKLQNHSNTPYSRRGHSQDRPPESPRSAHSATPPSGPTASESCSERLKAVANMVKIRSSPAPSPKPSVACSQLALLLSSEAHLQQYSREHALKAQLSGRSASERLAAMANQQQGPEKRPPSDGGTLPGDPDTLSSAATQNGMTATTTITTTLPRTALSSPQSPTLLHGLSKSSSPTPPYAPNHNHSHPAREKRGFDSRPTRPPQTCSSLLLLLLNNHNTQKQLTKNGHVEASCGILLPSGSSSVTSDSECSTQDRSLTKDSSDAESSYSSCSPIDLSMRNRAYTQDPGSKTITSSSAFSSSTSTLSLSTTVFSSTSVAFSPQASAQPTTTAFSPSSVTVVSSVSTAISSSSSSSISTSSLDKLTQSLINKWKPEPSGSKMSKSKELDMNSDLKSHPKVTLMQLLLERRNEIVNRSVGNQDLPLDITKTTMSGAKPKGLMSWEETRTQSPMDRPAAPAQPLYSLSCDPSSALSPFSYPSPHVQSSPLDLCKSKTFPTEKASEPAFSASKLLQNLAQCGTASSSSPIPSSKEVGQELDTSRPLALLERLNAPVLRTTTTPLSDGPSGSGTPFGQKEASPPSSQIENLLERRTVLQLLLGTGSTTATVTRKDRSSGRRSLEIPAACYEMSPSAPVVCDSSNGPPFDVKVKTEITEDVGTSSAMSEDSIGRKRPYGYEKNSPLSDSQQDFKKEPRPAEVIAKYGLLSQLLKQQTATYYTTAALPTELEPRPVKEEQMEYPSPSPKKRRLCSDHTDNLHNISSTKAVSGGDTNVFAYSDIQEESDQQRSLKEEEASSRSPQNDTLSRESRGFNVLKQLLLSDNCLKELSQQPRGTHSPSVLKANGKANGSIPTQPSHNHNFAHLPGWDSHGSLNSGIPSNRRPLPIPPAGDSPICNPWSCHPAPWPVTQKRDSPTLVKQEPKSPVQWSSQENEEENCDSNQDSPRLSRSNPILYYMLQKGSIQLRKEVRDPTEGMQSVVRVKEEPISDMPAYEHSLSSNPQSPAHNEKHSHESQGLSQSSE